MIKVVDCPKITEKVLFILGHLFVSHLQNMKLSWSDDRLFLKDLIFLQIFFFFDFKFFILHEIFISKVAQKEIVSFRE